MGAGRILVYAFFPFNDHLGHAVLFFLLHLPRKNENELKMFFCFMTIAVVSSYQMARYYFHSNL